jgi:type II secretory pathway pseudopilin PulG
MFRRTEAGFSLVDLLVTITVIGMVAGMATPTLLNVADRMKLGQALREVERELQTARLKAVTSNRTLRVRFNCPVVGQYRMVELLGTPATPLAEDTSATRCKEAAYPFPATDANPLTVPNLDGPLRRLPTVVTFGAVQTLEFWPDGSVHSDNGSGNPWPIIPKTSTSDGTAITLVKGSDVRRITVNSLGKVTLVQ